MISQEQADRTALWRPRTNPNEFNGSSRHFHYLRFAMRAQSPLQRNHEQSDMNGPFQDAPEGLRFSSGPANISARADPSCTTHTVIKSGKTT